MNSKIGSRRHQLEFAVSILYEKQDRNLRTHCDYVDRVAYKVDCIIRT